MKTNKKTFVHVLGAIAYALSQWLIVAFIVRKYSLEFTGIYAYYMAIFTSASALLGLGLRNSLASDANRQFNNESYLSAKTYGAMVFLCVFVFIFINNNTDKILISVVFFAKLFELNSELIYGEWVRSGNAERYGYSKILKLFSFILFIILFYFINISEEYFLLCYPISILLVYFLYDKNNSNLYLKTKDGDIDYFYKNKNVINLIKTSIPLAVGSFVISLNAGIPRIVLKNILGNESVAIYVLILYFVSFALIPASSVSQIYISRFSKIKTKVFQDHNVNKLGKYFLYYGLFFILFMIFLSHFLLSVIYDVKNGYVFNDLLFVGFAGFFQILSILGNSILVALRKFKSILYSSCTCVALTAVFGVGFTNWFGISGMFFSYFFVSLMSFTLIFYQIKKISK